MFPVTADELQQRLPQGAEPSRVIKLRGLPYECERADVERFFRGSLGGERAARRQRGRPRDGQMQRGAAASCSTCTCARAPT